MIPLLHDLTGTTILVFGGGAVGARKARRFAREGHVIVVSPAFADAEFGGAELVRAAPTPEELPGWFERAEPALVVAATDDPELNEAIETEARERGVLRNRADRSGAREFGSVVVPATVRDDPVTIAVATGARSPALSRYLREELETEFEGVGAMAELAGRLRGELRERDLTPEERRRALRAVVRSPDVWKALGAREPKRTQVTETVIRTALSDGENE